MGTYLSTPVTEKDKESGEALECPAAPLVWGVVDMQGWRKSMEDSHVAQTNVQVPPHLQTDQDHDAKVFGVFDGHGGAEVARFTQLYLVDVLEKQPTWIKETTEENVSSPVGQALVDAFHALDRMIDQPERRDELIRLRAEKPPPGAYKTVGDIPIPPEKIHHDPASFVKIGEGNIYEQRSDDGAQEDQAKSSIEMNEMSTVSEEKRESVDDGESEAEKEVLEEPKVEEATDESKASDSPAVEDMKEEAAEQTETKEAATEGDEKMEETPFEKEAPEAKESDVVNASSEMADEPGENAAEAMNGTEEPAAEEPDKGTGAEASNAVEKKEVPVVAEQTENLDQPEAQQDSTDEPNTEATEEAPALKEEPETVGNSEDEKVNGDKNTLEEEGAAKEDDDSNAAVGKEDAAKLDQDLMIEDTEEPAEVTNRKVTVMFQKLLSLGGNSGQMSLRIADKESAEQSDPVSAVSVTGSSSSPAVVPTIIQNGRQICNLPDHPIHAGCTAIVAVLIGRKLTVANAGDSRAVLCRAGGRAEALSFDHKPQQDRELNRINNAGGFVNQFGRVNGNLNLSRSIGDLKYKQVPGIHPAGQMITAEPDIVEVFLQSNDEFVILGCDGIWDCLTNNQAVKYVRERIDTMSPTEIGAQMLDEIISDDPRATQGIGGDNMTVMVIDLQPSKRSYRNTTANEES